MTKRLFDLIASSIGLVVLAPVMVIIGVLVKRDSAGPALFKQERIGLGGKPFTLLKFRSMVEVPVPVGPLVTASSDTRITRIGAQLRSTKLDELPQLLNVLRGDMSIVGPRPEVAKYVALWREEDRRIILSVRPGITDPMTIELRREEAILAEQLDPEQYYVRSLMPKKVESYLEYAETRTMRGDLTIIMTTLIAVLKG